MERIGARVFRHGIVDSTSERAFAALAAGEARHGDVHVALGQTAGRGRRGSVWTSPAEEGLYASVVLAPPLLGQAPPEPAGWTILAGVATRDALQALGLQRARLKWPNDLVVDGAKLAGILVEARGLEPEHPAFVVGIGINVAQREFPAELLAERPVTSLLLQGLVLTPERCLAELCPALERRLEELLHRPRALSAAYLAATELHERKVRVQLGAALHSGALAGLDLRQGLLLRSADGETRRLPLAHVTAVEAL